MSNQVLSSIEIDFVNGKFLRDHHDLWIILLKECQIRNLSNGVTLITFLGIIFEVRNTL